MKFQVKGSACSTCFALARSCARCGSQLPTLTGIRLAHAEAIIRHEVGPGSWSRSCSWLYRGLVVVSAAGPLFTEAVGVGVGVGAARRSW